MSIFPSPALRAEYELFLKCRPLLCGPAPPTFEQWLECRKAFVGPEGPAGAQGPAGPAGPAGGPVLDPAQLAREGYLFVASTGEVEMPVNGSSLFLVLTNPADSGRLLQVVGVAANHYSIFSHLWVTLNPDVTGFTPVAAESTNAGQPVTPVAVPYTGVIPPPTTPPGVLVARNLAVSPWLLNTYIRGSWVVPPGTGLGFVLYFYASSATYTFGMVSVMWAEVEVEAAAG